MSKWQLIQNQPLLRERYKEPPIISYKKGKSLRGYTRESWLWKHISMSIWVAFGLSTLCSIPAGKVRVLKNKNFNHTSESTTGVLDKESVPSMWGIILPGYSHLAGAWPENMFPVCGALSSFGFALWLIPHVSLGWGVGVSSDRCIRIQWWIFSYEWVKLQFCTTSHARLKRTKQTRHNKVQEISFKEDPRSY